LMYHPADDVLPKILRNAFDIAGEAGSDRQ